MFAIIFRRAMTREILTTAISTSCFVLGGSNHNTRVVTIPENSQIKNNVWDTKNYDNNRSYIYVKESALSKAFGFYLS